MAVPASADPLAAATAGVSATATRTLAGATEVAPTAQTPTAPAPATPPEAGQTPVSAAGVAPSSRTPAAASTPEGPNIAVAGARTSPAGAAGPVRALVPAAAIHAGSAATKAITKTTQAVALDGKTSTVLHAAGALAHAPSLPSSLGSPPAPKRLARVLGGAVKSQPAGPLHAPALTRAPRAAGRAPEATQAAAGAALTLSPAGGGEEWGGGARASGALARLLPNTGAFTLAPGWQLSSTTTASPRPRLAPGYASELGRPIRPSAGKPTRAGSERPPRPTVVPGDGFTPTTAAPGGLGFPVLLALGVLLIVAAPSASRRLALTRQPWRLAPFFLIPARPG
jgi:hypothetical protein